MGKRYLFIFILFACLFFAKDIIAQEKAKTGITSVKRNGDMVRVTITSSKPFIYGNNRYILYVGNKEFTRNEQSKKNGIGYLTFLIPEDDFNSLNEGDSMYLNYGEVAIEHADMEKRAKGRLCWGLGKFSKALLK